MPGMMGALELRGMTAAATTPMHTSSSRLGGGEGAGLNRLQSISSISDHVCIKIHGDYSIMLVTSKS
jgi:hypothetical protein